MAWFRLETEVIVRDLCGRVSGRAGGVKTAATRKPGDPCESVMNRLCMPPIAGVATGGVGASTASVVGAPIHHTPKYNTLDNRMENRASTHVSFFLAAPFVG